MNCAEGLKKYYKNLEKDFHHQYVDILQGSGKETVHQLRLNMKKQKAFFHLLEYLDESFSTELALQAYGKLYKKAGKVRDYQVEKSVIHKEEKALNLEHRFSEWLDKQEEECREALRDYEVEHSLVPVRRLGHLIESRMDFLPEEGLKERFFNYFHQLITSVKESVHPERRNEEELHQLRKYIKELFYNVLLINDLCTKEKIDEEGVKALDGFQKLLGNWHDRYFTLQRIPANDEPCPDSLFQQLEQHRKELVEKVQQKLPEVPLLMDALEEELVEILDQEPLETTGRHRRRKGAAGSTHSAFRQWNVGEQTK